MVSLTLMLVIATISDGIKVVSYFHRLIRNNRQSTKCRLFRIYGLLFVYNNPEVEAQRSYAYT